MINIVFRCTCGKQMSVPEGSLVKRVRCNGCGSFVTVPEPSDDFDEHNAPSRRIRLGEGGKELVDTPAPETVVQRPNLSPGGPSVPAGLTVDYRLYCRCFPGTPLIHLTFLFASILLALVETRWWGLWGFVVVAALLNWLCWARVQAVGSRGLVCAAQVVSDRPYRIAVFADLAQDEGYWPVLRVLDQPLGRMTGGPPAVGELLSAIVTFEDASATTGHWKDLRALSAGCLTRDAQAIQRVMDLVPKKHWYILKEALARVKRREQPQLYKLRLPGSGWLLEEREEKAARRSLPRGAFDDRDDRHASEDV
jgi:hypothetical protein